MRPGYKSPFIPYSRSRYLKPGFQFPDIFFTILLWVKHIECICYNVFTFPLHHPVQFFQIGMLKNILEISFIVYTLSDNKR